jgi:hypothetical protein
LEELQAGDPSRAGPYLLIGRLGGGGMGQVFLGRSPGGRLVAVKIIRAERAQDPGFRSRFAREVVAARRVGGAFTAPVIDADPRAPLPWLVTSFVNGPSLAQAVADHGVLPDVSVLALAAGLAEGLGAVHAAGVVHRDLKPANVLLAEDGPRVIDFGISQAADVTVMTSTGAVMGSPGFMSPEQAEGKEVGAASDLFSLGAVLIFAATGEGPFGAGTATARLYRVVHNPPDLGQLPSQLHPLVERCLAKDPSQRPTAAQFLAELTAAHPSAANLVNWLPAAILPPTLVLPGAADPDYEPTAADGASSGEPGPEANFPPTLTTAGDQKTPAATPGPARRNRLTLKTGALARFITVTGRTVTGRMAGRMRRPWLVSVLAIAAVLGTVAGLLIADPWQSPPAPVLRPDGLLADSSTIGSLSFRWSGPASGPAPDRYEIMRDDHRIGSVPGNITYYRDNGLAPRSPYEYEVIAIRDGKRSRLSRAIDMSTLTPPLSAAALDGDWSVDSKVTAVRTAYGPAYKAGDTFSDSWSFTPACAAGPCDMRLSGQLDGVSFATSLTRSGAVYTGTANLKNYTYCVHKTDTENATIDIQVHVTEATPVATRWEADRWSGTVTLNIARDRQKVCSSEIDKIVTDATP